jgi:hypothetical protein
MNNPKGLRLWSTVGDKSLVTLPLIPATAVTAVTAGTAVYILEQK